MRALSLHHLVALDASAAELVAAAAQTGCAHVCLFTEDPGGPRRFPVVRDEDVPALRALMAAHGLSAWGVTSFGISEGVNVGDFAAGLARGAALGARVASVRILDRDLDRAAAAYAQLCDLAAAHGLRACIEHSGATAAETLARALQVLRAAGRPGGGITLDALHVFRTGTKVAELRALDPALVGYVQLCDGKREATAEEYQREGAGDRLLPGEGEFPLAELLAAAPEGLPISLEVPLERFRAMGRSPLERAAMVVAAARAVMSP